MYQLWTSKGTEETMGGGSKHFGEKSWGTRLSSLTLYGPQREISGDKGLLEWT